MAAALAAARRASASVLWPPRFTIRFDFRIRITGRCRDSIQSIAFKTFKSLHHDQVLGTRLPVRGSLRLPLQRHWQLEPAELTQTQLRLLFRISVGCTQAVAVPPALHSAAGGLRRLGTRNCDAGQSLPVVADCQWPRARLVPAAPAGAGSLAPWDCNWPAA